MNIQGRLDTLIQYIRRARRSISSVSFLLTILLYSLFVAGSYYFLFNYYERMVGIYYASLLRSISQYQQQLIGRVSYWKDIEHMCTLLSKNRGVLDVWCTDRFGKLIYNTDIKMNEQYRGKRMPSEYFESINHVWEFQDGYPVAKRVAVNGFLEYRVSIPLYSFGQELHDFVVGMDVKRFVFLSNKMTTILLFLGGYVIFTILLIHLPFFFWIRSRFSRMASQARMVIGAIQVEVEKEASQSLPAREPPAESMAQEEALEVQEEASEEEKWVPPAVQAREIPVIPEPAVEEETIEEEVAEEEVSEEEVSEEEAPEEEVSEEVAREKWVSEEVEETGRTLEEPPPTIPTEVEIAGMEEKLKSNPILYLMDAKQSLFRKENLSLDFLQAVSYNYNSKSSEGSYLLYQAGDNLHFYAIFSYPDVNPVFATDQLSLIAEYFRSAIGVEPQSRHLFKTLNLYCLENNLHLDLSSVLIRADERKMEYSSCGKGQAIYLKNKENVVKSLNLDIDALGIISDAELEEAFSYAEIEFGSGDLFVLLPQNVDEVHIEGESMQNLIKRMLLDSGQLGAEEIASMITEQIEQYRKKDRKFPQTGFVLFKFL